MKVNRKALNVLGKLKAWPLHAALLLTLTCHAQTTVLSTVSAWDGAGVATSFGQPSGVAADTYGQTFTVPAGYGILTDITFRLGYNFGQGITFTGYLMAWDGSEAKGSVLYQSPSATVDSNTSGIAVFDFPIPDVSLTSGSTYVFFLLAGAGSGGAATAKFAVTGDNSSYTGGNFVFTSSGGSFANLSTAWQQPDTPGVFGDAVFTATLVSHAAQTITFATIPSQVAGKSIDISASSSSGLPVRLANQSPNPVCTVTNTTANHASVSLNQYGFCYVVASQAGNATYAAATPVLQTFGVSHAAQTIAFGAIASQVAGTTLPLTATASSALPVSYTSLSPTVCTVSGTSASLIAFGTCFIEASQAGNAEYSTAPSVEQGFGVAHGTQSISFPAIATQVAATTLHLTATASSGLPVAFASLTPSICSVTGASASFTAFGTCTIQASQNGNNASGNSEFFAAPAISRSFQVAHAHQTIAFGPIAVQTAATSLNLSATATSGLAVSYISLSPAVCTVSGTKASLKTYGTCILQAQQPGNGEYLGAPSVDQSFGVSHASQTITFAPIASQPVNSTLNLSATASSGLPVSFQSLTPAVCSVSGTTASLNALGNCIIQASQSGNNVYNGAPSVNHGFTVID
jgi:hypothetical protein